MSDQKHYQTEVTLKITLGHYETCQPQHVVEALKTLIKCPMVVSVEQVGELLTAPEWPWPKKENQ